MTTLPDALPRWAKPAAHRLGVVLAAGPGSAELAAAIEAAAGEADCAVAGADVSEDVRAELSSVRALRAQGVDGVLLSPSPGADTVVTELVRLGVPTVLVDRLAVRTDVDQVGAENVQATSALAEHLAALGHRRIGLVGGAPGLAASEERALGYRLGLGRAGLTFDQALVACGRSTPDGAAVAARGLLDGSDPPSALVVGGESMLAGVLREAHRRGLRVGTDLALACYGDAPWVRDADPPVTAAAQPVREIGHTAVRLLLARLAEPDRPQETVRLPPALLHRASCGCRGA
ncbi:LacI family transcriptional regulator [Prauserella shujinwangii]|uniref:LacI family transcriptional regulator n=1 Tax=Prauserella shujinwangii TaxID=1453103 RepID=A0A2T0LUL9_9PSEU|nr:substrate-binding domain-containing protein [Prauserella shujinwangii]PRX47516.1 LacI family transcriptional regulator [Prauserella shujinwangii]